MIADNSSDFPIQRVVCNDRQCQAILFVTNLESEVTCYECGQTHKIRSLRDISEILRHEQNFAEASFVRRLIIQSAMPKRGTEMVKVLGLSNYYCKLLSPLLTRYGMDRETGEARLLKDMNRGDIFDCSSFGDRAFLIDPEHISIPGFGRDITGSIDYLSETLKLIKASNGDQERLLPVHADGDGHCLVHAISRALVGRELFWHPLRSCLKRHFESSLDKFKELFKDFIDSDEWNSIIEECDPEFKPPEGELHGLRNIHIFGLANVLRRPIILLDSLECMKKSGDYSALFLPGFVAPEECKGKDSSLNKPICIAWSSSGHNHYIPLVGIQRMPLPVLPSFLLPKVWGMPQSEINSYMEFDDFGNCTIGGSRVLSDNYIQRLVSAMEGQFFEEHKIHPSLVADVKLFLCSDHVLLNTKVATVILKAKSIVSEGRLFRCTYCKALCEMRMDANWFQRGGLFYNTLIRTQKSLTSGATYRIPLPDTTPYAIHCRYDVLNDVLIPDMTSSKLLKCTCCTSTDVEKLRIDGTPVSYNLAIETRSKMCSSSADTKSDTPVNDDLPKMLTIKIEWNDKVAEDVIPDFQLVSNEGLGEAVALMSASFIQKHFPEDVDQVDLRTYVADVILKKIGKSIYATVDLTEHSETIKEIKADLLMEIDKEAQAIPSDTKPSVDPKSSSFEPKYIRVISHSGRQVNLRLEEKGISYLQLQEWITEEFCIPKANQRIKIGFPPKTLEVPLTNAALPLPLKHGDRLTIEKCSQQDRVSNAANKRNIARDFSNSSNLTPYQCDAVLNFPNYSPEQFRKGGIYYEECAKSHILLDLHHFTIKSIPNKSFSYNCNSDSLELCVKPLGHFEISGDLQSRIEQVQAGETVNGYRNCPIMSLRPSSALLNRPVKKSQPSTAQSSTETQPDPLVRKGPGFSVLTSPKTSERMDLS